MNQEVMDEHIRKMDSKRCFRLFCRGVMILEDKKWTCPNCETKFCFLCENQHQGEKHFCRPEDVASVNWKKALPHCPKCNLPIEKKEGCDNMTCAACQQNFSYSTGNITQHGNHGQSIPVQISNESVQRLIQILPIEKNDKYQRIAKELKKIEKKLLEYNLATPSWDWKASDISILTKWMMEKNPQKEETKVARMVALQVEKFEYRRQEIRAILKKLRTIEDELIMQS
jgi:hypothetical protein